MQNCFNLIDEPWIPISDGRLVSLSDIFSSHRYRDLGGNPIQKIAILKFLLAIAQAAATPQDESDWQAMTDSDLAGMCLDYLHRWHHCFYLYGESPFLQMLAIQPAECKSFGTVLPEISTGNTTVLNQSQLQTKLSDADKALLLLVQMGFALSGKKTDNSVVLTPNYCGKSNAKGKPSSGKAGPSMGFMGYLHNFVLGESLIQTLRLNLLTHQDIADSARYPAGLGTAPWEAMPQGEDCPIAQQHKNTLMGRLVPLCRFCLLAEDGLHYSEGIAHPDYKAGGIDPTIAIDLSGKDPKVLWVNPARRPWRELTALLSFCQSGNGGFDCMQLRIATRRAVHCCAAFSIWSGGLRVSSNAGEQYASGEDDYVESIANLSSDFFGDDSDWFFSVQAEMDGLAYLAKLLYGCVMAYYKAFLIDGKGLAAIATALFWQLCERDFQSLIDCCGSCEEVDQKNRLRLRHGFIDHVQQAFNLQCPNQTARQMDAWGKSYPNFKKYLEQETV